jgi:diguanylate cyclase (GGDEF)-like protein
VAHVLAANCREYDTVARYGGEEFAIIMPSSTADQCRATAERLRKLVAKLPAEVPITLSVGIAVYPRYANDPEGLVATADYALYRSKRTGRNRVTVYVGPALEHARRPPSGEAEPRRDRLRR